MAINLAVTYVNTTAPDADYPYGSSKNETAPGALDGTPIEKAIYDDLLGLAQSLLAGAGIVPTNNPDSVQFPQYLTAIANMRYHDRVNYVPGSKVVGSDNVTYVCQVANGPATTAQDPVTESPRVIWFTEAGVMFGQLHPVGSLFMSVDSVNPGTTFGVGTWVQVEGKFIVGQDGADTDFDVGAETGGSKTHGHADSFGVDGHALTVAELAAHDHSYSKHNVGGDVQSGAGTTVVAFGSAGFTTGSKGNGDSHSHGLSGGVTDGDNVPPYFVAYIWRRTA